MSPSLSVIVPVYNTEKYLRRCVDSILNQEYKDMEIILVDDGSTDGSPCICDEYSKKDYRVKVVHKENQGLGFARNSGIEAAVGAYVGFIDSDDYITPDFYKNLINGSKGGSCDAVICGMSSQKGDEKVIKDHIYAGTYFDENKINSILLPSILGYDKYGKDHSDMSVCKCIFKRSLFNEWGIKFLSEREYISEDAIFCMEFYSRAKKVNVVSGAGYFYCYNGTSLTHKYNKDRFNQLKKLCQYELDLAEKYNLNKACRYRILSTFIGNVRVAVKQEAAHCTVTKRKEDRYRIRDIVYDDYLQSVLKEFDYSRLPKKQMIFCHCLRLKLWKTALLLANLRNKSE